MRKTTLQKYSIATLNDLIRVVVAAEDLYQIMAEFSDSPELWENEINALDVAIENCPGTNGHFHKENIEALSGKTDKGK